MRLRALLAAACFAGACFPVSAQQASGSFRVVLTLSVPGAPVQETCINETRAATLNAVVQVVCRSGTYVGIEPRSRLPFFGAQGGAFRLSLRSHGGDNDAFALAAGASSVTGLRVAHFHLLESPLEILIVF